MINKRTEGKKAEDIVAEHLQTLNYQIIEQNYTIRGGEIYIIAKQGEKIVFVEVKSLASERYIQLEESISQKKRKALVKTCRIWLAHHKQQHSDWRIDFVGIVIDNNRAKKIVHIEGAIW